MVSHAVIPHMRKKGTGRIVNIASVAGIVPLRLQSAFVAAKAGVVNLTKAMAIELGSAGILVSAAYGRVALASGLQRGERPCTHPARSNLGCFCFQYLKADRGAALL